MDQALSTDPDPERDLWNKVTVIEISTTSIDRIVKDLASALVSVMVHVIISHRSRARSESLGRDKLVHSRSMHT